MRKVLFILILTSLFSCKTVKEEPEVIEQVVEPVIEPIAEPIPEPEPEPIVEAVEEPEEYVATEEEYDQTFDEVEEFILMLNDIISSNDFNTWKGYLSDSYISEYSDSDFLNQLSNNPILKDYGIKIKNLRDYFRYVVVPSRSNVVISEIQFITENEIKALTYANNRKFVVYSLLKSDNGWIITD